MMMNRFSVLAAALGTAWPMMAQAASWQISEVDAKVEAHTATDCRTGCTPDQQDDFKISKPGMSAVLVMPSSRSADAGDPSYSASMSGMANVIVDLGTPGREFIHVYATSNAHYEGDWAAHDPADVAAHIAPASAVGDAGSTLTFRIDAPLYAALTGTAFNGSVSLTRLGLGAQADQQIISLDAPASTMQSGPLAMTLLPGTYRAMAGSSVHQSWFDMPPNSAFDATGAGGSAYLLIKAAVPEPSATAMAAAGLLAWVMMWRKKRGVPGGILPL